MFLYTFDNVTEFQKFKTCHCSCLFNYAIYRHSKFFVESNVNSYKTADFYLPSKLAIFTARKPASASDWSTEVPDPPRRLCSDGGRGDGSTEGRGRIQDIPAVSADPRTDGHTQTSLPQSHVHSSDHGEVQQATS